MYNRIVLSHIKGIFAISMTWVDLDGILLSEIKQTEKNTYCVILLIFGI